MRKESLKFYRDLGLTRAVRYATLITLFLSAFDICVYNALSGKRVIAYCVHPYPPGHPGKETSWS